jgi:hypothetical protein
MNAIDVIRAALTTSDRSIMMLVEDARSMPLTQPTPRGGNHPLWVMGHITFVEAGIPHVLFGEPHPLADWAPLFAAGSEPLTDASAYPPFDEVVRRYRQARERNLKILDEIGNAGLDQPTKAPPRGLEEILRTVGETFLVIAMHHMGHRGQLADARRAAGRKPIFTPGMN